MHVVAYDSSHCVKILIVIWICTGVQNGVESTHSLDNLVVLGPIPMSFSPTVLRYRLFPGLGVLQYRNITSFEDILNRMRDVASGLHLD